MNHNDYKCLKYLAVNVNYDEAETVCKNSNSTLATIRTSDEFDFVQNIARTYSTLSGVHWVWLGAKRDNTTSNLKSFKWLDGSPVESNFWRDGCPDERAQDDCVLMTVFRDRPSHWCNYRCATNYDHVLCEKPFSLNDSTSSSSSPGSSSSSRPADDEIPIAVPTSRNRHNPLTPWTWNRSRIPYNPYPRRHLPSESDECPFGWDFKYNKCYRFITDKITGEEARYYCARYGANAQPMTIHNEMQQTWAIELAFFKNEAKEAVWIGLRRTGPNETNFAWRDATPMDFINWAPHEPDNRNSSEWCVAINDTPKFYGRWLDAPCALRFHLICEKPGRIIQPSSTIPPIILKAWSDNLLDDDTESEAIASTTLTSTSTTTSSSTLVVLLIILVIVFATVSSALAYTLLNQRKNIGKVYESQLNLHFNSSVDDETYATPYSPTTVAYDQLNSPVVNNNHSSSA